ncbi:DinB family protein [Chryseolinea lacunae]|uniref:DinB family protein n=1 Tax=Chryseolinea lacunae TaxID=2801331 RepID=A0ABS1L1T3_9BACT|nr:DinB family protein [Chryseolinea lacunae]MBL0745467.1 DinB family protein [Chryseolinea lacunae]
MTEIETLTLQTESAYAWTNKLLNSIPFEKWDTLPDVLETTVTWQVGHLIMSHYFHTAMVIVGHQMDILKQVPLKEYDAMFTEASPIISIGKTNAETLFGQLNLVQQKSLSIIKSLPIEALTSKLEPTPTPHPVATTKFESLDWNIKHTMYHCGQIGILKRVVDERYDFGLRRVEK